MDVDDIWRVVAPDEPAGHNAAVRLEGDAPDSTARLYISDSDHISGPGPTIHLPGQLKHVAPGDVLSISPDGHRVRVVWKADATHNSILLTERCDNYCIMCSQPPKEQDDGYLYLRASKIIDALPARATHVALTGGEPTVDGASFLDLLQHIQLTKPTLGVHVLSNGRKFSDRTFAGAFADIGLADAMVGVPLYSSEPSLHDFVVQAPGAFEQTVRGILTLGAVGVRIEIRVVLQQSTVPVLSEIATYIARNLPFVDQVALMGLEMTGLALPNASIVWIDPDDYRKELTAAHRILSAARIPTRIYNHPLCVTDEELWPAAVQSISDWKNDFPELCEPCVMREKCAGVFTTSKSRISTHLRPILERHI